MSRHCTHTTLDKFMGCVLVYCITVAVVDLGSFIVNEISIFMGEEGRFIPLPFPELWLDKFAEVFPLRFVQFEGMIGLIIMAFFLLVLKTADFLKKPDKDK